MILTEKHIQEYRRIHQAEFGEVISDQEAREIAVRVIQLYEILVRPLPDEEQLESKKKPTK